MGKSKKDKSKKNRSKNKTKQKKGNARYWTAGTEGAAVAVSGRWIHIDLPKGKKVRVELTDALRREIASAGTTAGERDSHLDELYRETEGGPEGPVPFESFDYDDMEAECEVYDMDSGWQNWPRQAPEGGGGARLKKVVQTRVKNSAGVVVVTGQPSPAPGSGAYIRSCQGSSQTLTLKNKTNI
jgi:hypothetical protein